MVCLGIISWSKNPKNKRISKLWKCNKGIALRVRMIKHLLNNNWKDTNSSLKSFFIHANGNRMAVQQLAKILNLSSCNNSKKKTMILVIKMLIIMVAPIIIKIIAIV